MMGRAAYQTPALLAEVDARFFDGAAQRSKMAVEAYIDYVAQQLRKACR